MKTFLGLIFSLLLSFSLHINLFPQTVNELIEKGDKFYEEFQNQKALEAYLQAEKKDNKNWEILWRISRTYVDIAEHMPDKDEDAQLQVFEKALSYAERSVKLAPNEAITYVRRAVVNGKIALFKGVFSVAEVVNKVKDDCEKAIKLGNGGNYTQSLAHYILGRTHAKISEKWAPARAVIGLGWADIEIALKEFKKAIELYPDFRMFHLDIAKAYISEDEFSKAKDHLNKISSIPKKDEDDDELLAEAKNLLIEIKDED